MSKQITTYTEYLNYKKAMEDELMMMCKKNRPHNVFVCSGQAGIGKTYTASSIFEKYAEVPYIVKGGSISPVELYTTMWQNPDAVIILDDVNEIIKDPKNGAALLKIATDSYKVRIFFCPSSSLGFSVIDKYRLSSSLYTMLSGKPSK